MSEFTPSSIRLPRAKVELPVRVRPLTLNHRGRKVPEPGVHVYSAHEIKSRRLKQRRLEYIKLNAGNHELRQPLTSLFSFAKLIDLELRQRHSMTLQSKKLDPTFDLEEFRTLTQLAVAAVTSDGNLTFNANDLDDIRNSDTVLKLSEAAQLHQVHRKLLKRLVGISASKVEVSPAELSKLQEEVFSAAFTRKVARLGNRELRDFIANPGPKQPAQIKSFYQKVFELLRGDIGKLRDEILPNLNDHLADELRRYPELPENKQLNNLTTLIAPLLHTVPEDLDSSLLLFNIEHTNFLEGHMPLSVAHMIQKVTSRNSTRLSGNNIACETLGDTAETLSILAQPQTWFVLNNLMTNAIKFVDNPRKMIKIVVKDLETHVLVAVADNGMGIDLQKHNQYDRLFQPGVSAVQNDPKMVRSTGVGLWMAYKIIDGQKGIIGVDSEPGKGAVFYFVLPKSIEGTNITHLFRQQAADEARRIRESLLKAGAVTILPQQ